MNSATEISCPKCSKPTETTNYPVDSGNSQKAWIHWLPLQLTSCVTTGRVKVKVAQSCPTLCNPMDYTVHGILQARILEWVTFPFSRGSSQPRDWTQVSHTAGGFFTSWATRLLGPHPYLSGLMKATIISSIGTHDCGLNEMTSLMCPHKSL